MDRDVAGDGEAEATTGFVHPAQRHLDRQPMAVARQVGALEDEARGLSKRPHPLLDGVARLGGVEIAPVHGQQRGARIPERHAGRLVDLDDEARTAVVGQLVGADRVAARFEEGTIAPPVVRPVTVGRGLPGAGAKPGDPRGDEGGGQQDEHDEPAGESGEGGRQQEPDGGRCRRAAHKGRRYPASHGLPCRGSLHQKGSARPRPSLSHKVDQRLVRLEFGAHRAGRRPRPRAVRRLRPDRRRR